MPTAFQPDISAVVSRILKKLLAGKRCSADASVRRRHRCRAEAAWPGAAPGAHALLCCHHHSFNDAIGAIFQKIALYVCGPWSVGGGSSRSFAFVRRVGGFGGSGRGKQQLTQRRQEAKAQSSRSCEAKAICRSLARGTGRSPHSVASLHRCAFALKLTAGVLLLRCVCVRKALRPRQ